MSLRWVDAHTWAEKHTIAMDSEMASPSANEIKKKLEEDNKVINFNDTGINDNLKYLANKMITYCMNHVNQHFMIREVVKDEPEVRGVHYKKIFELAQKDLHKRGYYLEKSGPWYKCTKER